MSLDTGFHDSLRGSARKGPGLQPGRRRRAAPAGLRLLGLRAPGTGPPFRRALPHPPPGGRRLPGRHEARRRGHRRRPAPRRRRGHADHHRAHPGAVRPRGRARRRGRHQDQRHPLLVERGAAGRELPQDAAGDGGRHPRHPRQARRPPAQHADAQPPARGAPHADRPGDARHLRADRQPARA